MGLLNQNLPHNLSKTLLLLLHPADYQQEGLSKWLCSSFLPVKGFFLLDSVACLGIKFGGGWIAIRILIVTDAE